MLDHNNYSELTTTIYARVCDALRSAILSGDFAPGQRLKMADLTSRFGVSPTAIREALQQLQGEGLITIFPHRGASVRSVDIRFVGNIYDLRFAIENMLVRKASNIIDQKTIYKLSKAQDKYDKLAKHLDISKLLQANQVLHNIHNQVADNEEALFALNRRNTLLRALRMRYGFGKNRIAGICIEHHELIAAFELHDPEAAAAVHTRHFENAKRDLLDLMESSS